MAGKLGPSHVVFWVLALVLFYLPSAAVVIYLNRLMPLEGGLYQWAKLGFNQTVGFMLAWNLWLYVIVFTSEIGLQCATYLSYAIGPSAAWMTTSSGFVALATAALLSLMVVTSIVGLSVGKWVHNTGGIFMITIFGTVVLLPLIGLLTGTLPAYHPFPDRLPELSLFNLNILGKMGFGALGGFEYMAILAGETQVAGTLRQPLGVHRGAGHRADVRAGHEHRRRLCPDRRHRPHRARGAGAAGRLRSVRHRRAARDRRHPDDTGDADRPGERGLHRGDAPADGGRVGQHAAGVVQQAARHLQDPGELDPARRRVVVRDCVVEPDRRRACGGVSASLQRQPESSMP